MLYIFYKKNKTHLCFKSASVLWAEGGGKRYTRTGHVPSPRALLLLPEQVRRASATASMTEDAKAVTMALSKNRCCLFLSQKSETVQWVALWGSVRPQPSGNEDMVPCTVASRGVCLGTMDRLIAVPKVGAQQLVAEPKSSGCLPLSSLGVGLSFGFCWTEVAMWAVGHSEQTMNTGEDTGGESPGPRPALGCL